MKKENIALIILYIFIAMAFAISIYKNNKYIKLTTEDLSFAQIEYSHYEKRTYRRKSEKYLIYSTNGLKFGIDGIVDVDEEKLANIEKHELLHIYYIDSEKKLFEKEVIEIYIDDEAILSLDTYKSSYRENTIINICLCAGFGVLLFVAAIINNKYTKYTKESVKKINFDSFKNKKAYEEFKSRIKYDSYTNIYTVNFNNCFTKDKDLLILCKLFADELKNQELRIFFEEEAPSEIAYFAFKLNNKIYFDFIYKDENEKYILEYYRILWTYPISNVFSKSERKTFEKQLEYVSALNSIEVIIKKE